MNFSPRFLALLLVACFIIAPVAPALAASKIAVVNIQQIMRDAKVAKAAREQLNNKQKQFQGELDQKEKQLQAEDQALAKQRNVLSQEAFQKQRNDFMQKATEAQREARTKRAKLDKGFNQALGAIQTKVISIVEAVAREKGFDMALAGSSVLYAANESDITAEVLSRLDAQMPTMTVTFE